MDKPDDFYGEQKELTSQLFAAVTALLEDAHEVAIAGQSRQLPASALQEHAIQLRKLVEEIDCVARAASIIAKHTDNPI